MRVALQDADAGLYDCLHLNFTSEIPRSLMDSLAEGEAFSLRLCIVLCHIVSVRGNTRQAGQARLD